MAEEKPFVPKIRFWRNRVIIPAATWIAGPIIAWVENARCVRYKPKAKTFLLLANHTAAMDPAYELISLRRYVRYVCSDHVIRYGFLGKLLNFFDTPVIKYRTHPKGEITQRILATLKAGISVGLHAEGVVSISGGPRYISPNTATLVKEAGCAVITYRNYGGYLRQPRWGKERRKGPMTCQVVREYSPEELAAMTEEEVYDMICRDLGVNAYERQREVPARYTGKDLAEHCEIVLYQCPKCLQVGTLHSHGDSFSCDCGYTVDMEPDGFFHDRGHGLVYDSVWDWYLWQREAVKGYLDGFADKPDVPAFRDEGQIIRRVGQGESRDLPVISTRAVLELYYDRMELRWEDGSWSAKLSDITKLDYAKRQTLLLVAGEDYFDIGSDRPRSPLKYIDAWRYLTGRPNY